MNQEINPDNLKLLFGIKVKSYRTRQSLSLQALAKRTGMAVSYLSEIESGKKYPKPGKLISLAKALDVDYDTLVSARVDKSLDPFAALINSDLIRQFPFHLFGIAPGDIVGLFKNNALHANAFLQTFLQISRVYDLSLDNFLFAALRTYLRQHRNYFKEIEKEAAAFVTRHVLTIEKGTFRHLKGLLEKEFGYTVDDAILADHPELREFRSVFAGDGHLAVNPRLMDRQKAFILARELGFLSLGIKERPATSSWIKVENFDQLVNNFMASYFGGAILIDQHRLAGDLKAIFSEKTWQAEAFAGLLDRYRVTPEMLLYRLSQVLPGILDIDRIFYFRFTHTPDLHSVMLTKELNMTRTLLVYGLGLNEHYCRRTLPLQFLKTLHSQPDGTLCGAQKIEFIRSRDRFLLLAMARPLALFEERGSAIAVGIKQDRKSESVIRFMDDPEIPYTEVSETCERCPLTDCSERVVDAAVINRRNQVQRWESALAHLKI